MSCFICKLLYESFYVIYITFHCYLLGVEQRGVCVVRYPASDAVRERERVPRLFGTCTAAASRPWQPGGTLRIQVNITAELLVACELRVV